MSGHNSDCAVVPQPRALSLARSAFQSHCLHEPKSKSQLPARVHALLKNLGDQMGGQNIFGSQGNIGRVLQQILCYYELLRSASSERPFLNVCETGFNGGHSATVFLASLNISTARYYGFDLGDKPYKKSAAAYLNNSLFPGQLHLAYGQSHITGQSFFNAQRAAFACDVLSIDGDHTEPGGLRDWAVFGPKLATHGLLFFDDVGSGAHAGMSGPTKAWQRIVKAPANNLTVVGCAALPGRTDIVLQSNRISRKAMRASRGFCVAMQHKVSVTSSEACT